MGQRLFNLFPLIEDIEEEYISKRRTGLGRDDAVSELLDEYKAELTDTDGAPQVWTALAEVTGKRKELTQELLDKAVVSMEVLSARLLRENAPSVAVDWRRICDPAKIGKEAVYRPKREFDADWKPGDVFAVQLGSQLAEEAGIGQWYVLFYVVGHTDPACGKYELVYLKLCPPDGMPTTTAELNALGYLPWSVYNGKYHYLYQIGFKSPRSYKFYDFKKLGSFLQIAGPDLVQDSRGTHTNLIFTNNYTETGISHLEELVCVSYRRYGLIPITKSQA